MQVVKLNPTCYDGSQLHHAFAYEQAHVLGPTIVVFRGPAEVKDHLVDLEDSLANDFIKSEDMWHFIIEIPGATLLEMVALQRLFICKCIDNLRIHSPNITYVRNGDDIIVNGRKLSVSIATLSRFGGLIHAGINVKVGNGCPVAAIGLADFVSEDVINCFGYAMATEFVEEYDDIKDATYKVIEV